MKWTSEIIIIFLLDLAGAAVAASLYRLIMIMNGPVYTFGGHNFYSNWYGNKGASEWVSVTEHQNNSRQRQKEKYQPSQKKPSTTKHHVRENFQELTIINSRDTKSKCTA